MVIVLQVEIAQDIDSHSLTKSLLHFHQHTTVLMSLKTWSHVLLVGILWYRYILFVQ